MTSLSPALQAFWSGALVSSASFGVLESWSEIVQAPMPEAMQPPRPASHISSALRRVIDAPTPSQLEADAISPVLGVLHDHRDYCGTLLRFAADGLADILEGKSAPEEMQKTRSWLQDVGQVLEGYRGELLQLRRRLTAAERENLVPEAASAWIFDVAGRLYTRLVRAHAQLERVADLLTGRMNAAAVADVRRRFSWVNSLREFSRPLDWKDFRLSGLTRIPPALARNRFETGLVLLDHFRESVSEKEIALFERAATSRDLRDKDLAFDWRGVLGADLERGEALTELQAASGRYEVLYDDFVHQYDRLRIPYRGAQALALGLWAAGNRLRLYTGDADRREGYETLFNDFPLLKVAFELAPPDNAAVTVTRESLDVSKRYMDGAKRRSFGARYFTKPDDRLFLEMIQKRLAAKSTDLISVARIPFPDFPFDVLVESGTTSAPGLGALGFGNRWLASDGDAEGLLNALEAHAAKPVAGLSALVADWLDRWEIP